ncbi:hypothetical protein PM082_023738 [Marasmius tenuissimus]|nr:hypothetical protein PM082_023738 [Marasmius tenuissimus]
MAKSAKKSSKLATAAQTAIPAVPPTEPPMTDTDYAEDGFDCSYTAILADHYYEEWKQFCEKVNPDAKQTKRIPAIADYKNDKTNEILALIKKGIAPWDKCKKLDPSQRTEDFRRCVRWFTNQRIHKFIKQTNALTREDAQKALNKLIGFSSDVKPRQLFREEMKDSILEEAEKLVNTHQTARYSVAESQMWQKADHDKWQRKADLRYNLDQNQEELPTLMQMFMKAVAVSGHVGPFQAFMVLSTRNSKGHVKTSMVEAGSSDSEFVKTWRPGKNFKDCEEEAEKVFQNTFDKWAKSVLPSQASNNGDAKDGQGEFDPSIFVEDDDGNLLFPAIDMAQTPPAAIALYVQRFFKLVFEKQHKADLPWTEIAESPDKFYDTTILSLRLYDLRDTKVRTSKAITLAEELHDLSSPFRFHGSLAVENLPLEPAKALDHSATAILSLPLLGDPDKAIDVGDEMFTARLVDPMATDDDPTNPLTPNAAASSRIPQPLPTADQEATPNEPQHDSVTADIDRPAIGGKRKKTTAVNGGPKTKSSGNARKGALKKGASGEQPQRSNGEGKSEENTSQKRKRVVEGVDLNNIEEAGPSSGGKKRKVTQPNGGVDIATTASGTQRRHIAGRPAKAGKFWDNVVEAANKKGTLEKEPEVFEKSTRSGKYTLYT